MPPASTNLLDLVIQALLRVGLAIVLWIVGRLVISVVLKLAKRALEARKIDATAVRYMISALNLLLNVILIFALLGVFGIQTTGFAAILAGAGVAIGVAVSGLLAHFAAGLFMLTLRPFKVGDFIVAGGVTGTVTELGLLHTKIDTPDNVSTMVGNNTIFNGTIQNFSANPYRRVLLPVQLAGSADHRQAIALLEDLGKKIPNVIAAPAPSASISEFKPAGPVVTLAVFCNNNDYWQVVFDGNRMIREAFTAAAFPAPMETLQVLSAA
jgi:small conductance mechanosensitive channel